LAEPDLIAKIAEDLLWEHFPESIHDDIVAQIGLTKSDSLEIENQKSTANQIKQRDP
jgi:hypothetical protein